MRDCMGPSNVCFYSIVAASSLVRYLPGSRVLDAKIAGEQVCWARNPLDASCFDIFDHLKNAVRYDEGQIRPKNRQ